MAKYSLNIKEILSLFWDTRLDSNLEGLEGVVMS